ncbi:hypothetical protein L207DRAFT_536511 [Hyaloscypha variabilis F]|uniref:Uncharacterized protein n=1 Tax=Hyaloscypha variabilis (strain UAMH 11265 / GT02V1 / F) TaxID=1149755 RepID=A0A2J6R0P7_HYAVF|nr:hypothetical protein L207DRAFT_536511 [Hyaloscypha variabilis F]
MVALLILVFIFLALYYRRRSAAKKLLHLQNENPNSTANSAKPELDANTTEARPKVGAGIASAGVAETGGEGSEEKGELERRRGAELDGGGGGQVAVGAGSERAELEGRRGAREAEVFEMS